VEKDVIKNGKQSYEIGRLVFGFGFFTSSSPSAKVILWNNGFVAVNAKVLRLPLHGLSSI
jgi:hypothetical protein